MKNPNSSKVILTSICVSLLIVLNVVAQSQEADIRELLSGQTIEREMTGADTHRYKFDLKANEFFQVQVEQKGVDVMLKILASDGNILATMDSPNGKEGPETLSFIAKQDGTYKLEISGFDEKAEKGIYTIKRETPRTATAKDKRRVEVEKLFGDGIKAIKTNETKDQQVVALSKLEKAVKGWEELEEEYLIDLTAVNLFLLASKLPQDIFEDAQQLINIGTQESILESREKSLKSLELLHEYYIQLDEPVFTNILIKYKNDKTFFKLTNKLIESNVLDHIATCYIRLGEFEEGLKYNQKSLSVINEIRTNKELSSSLDNALEKFLDVKEATNLSSIGSTLSHSLDKPKESLTYINQAIVLFRKIQNENEDRKEFAKISEMVALQTLGSSYTKLNDVSNALKFLYESLSLSKKITNEESFEAQNLMYISGVYFSTFNYEKALLYLNQLLKIAEKTNNIALKVNALSRIKVIHYDLGDEKTSKEFAIQENAILLSPDYMYAEAVKIQGENPPIPLSSEPKNQNKPKFLSKFYEKQVESNRLNLIGNNYKLLEEYEKALKYYEQALTIAYEIKVVSLEGIIINQMADLYMKRKQWDKAIKYSQKSLAIERKRGIKNDIALSLRDVGFSYLESGNTKEALLYFKEAISIWITIDANKSQGIYRHYVTTLSHTARAYEASNNRKLAILFEKLAIDATQREREQLQNLDVQSQRGYLKKNEKPFRSLVNWLISNNRLSEAIQVMNSFKDEQFFDFDKSNVKDSSPLTLTAREAEFFSLYENASLRISEVGGRLEELKRNIGGRQPTAEESTELQKLENELKTASDEFSMVLTNAEIEFSKKTGEKDLVGEVPDLKEMQKALRDLNGQTGQKAVAVYQVVGEENFSALVITPDSIEKFEVSCEKTELACKGAELNEKALQLWALLKSDKYDTTKLSKEIYDVVFKPLEEKLPKDTTTIMWATDGNLRYLPMAALFDGERFLVERYTHSVFTRADPERMTRKVSESWTGIGFGSSNAATVKVLGSDISFNALPGVTKELSEIFKAGKKGILNGETYSDKQFTKPNFIKALKTQRPLVHIASHFSFRPGDEARSFLLMGDQTAFTLEEMKREENLFNGVELLTLSACNTAATQPGANGREIDGFAELAQRLGAGAVMATLWQVSDASTPWLMRDFYVTRESRSKMTKSEALQKAQLKLLSGTAKTNPQPNVTQINDVEIKIIPDNKKTSRDRSRSDIIELNESDAPLYKKDRSKPFAHPYYWSPFVIYGNWK